jgi:hypothetical protein
MRPTLERRENMNGRMCSSAKLSPSRRFVDPVLQHLTVAHATTKVSLNSVKKGIIALLGIVLALHVGISCGVAQAAAVIEVPCCGANCPFPSAAGGAACCEAQNSGAPAQAAYAKASHPSFQSVARYVHPCVVMPALTGVERACIFQNSLSNATKLALLCSRQI